MFLVKSGGDLAFEIYLPLLGPCLPLLGRLLALQAGDAQWGQHSSREGDRARDVQSGFWESKTVDFSFCPWQSPTFIPPINCKDSKSNIHVCSKMTLCAAQCNAMNASGADDTVEQILAQQQGGSTQGHQSRAMGDLFWWEIWAEGYLCVGAAAPWSAATFWICDHHVHRFTYRSSLSSFDF